MLTNRMRAVAAAVAGAVALSAVSFTPAEARSRRGDALALAAVAGVFGTIAALAARDRYYDSPVYYGSRSTAVRSMAVRSMPHRSIAVRASPYRHVGRGHYGHRRRR